MAEGGTLWIPLVSLLRFPFLGEKLPWSCPAGEERKPPSLPPSLEAFLGLIERSGGLVGWSILPDTVRPEARLLRLSAAALHRPALYWGGGVLAPLWQKSWLVFWAAGTAQGFHLLCGVLHSLRTAPRPVRCGQMPPAEQWRLGGPLEAVLPLPVKPMLFPTGGQAGGHLQAGAWGWSTQPAWGSRSSRRRPSAAVRHDPLSCPRQPFRISRCPPQRTWQVWPQEQLQSTVGETMGGPFASPLILPPGAVAPPRSPSYGSGQGAWKRRFGKEGSVDGESLTHPGPRESEAKVLLWEQRLEEAASAERRPLDRERKQAQASLVNLLTGTVSDSLVRDLFVLLCLGLCLSPIREF